MDENFINDNIFNKNFTIKQIAIFLKYYCDLYFSLHLSDKEFTYILHYFYSQKSTFIQPNESLNTTISKILGKKRSYTILLLLEKYFQSI
jgi:uncharacterized protein (TIGR04540 family)